MEINQAVEFVVALATPDDNPDLPAGRRSDAADAQTISELPANNTSLSFRPLGALVTPCL
jgi:hypothetical protein